VLHLASYEFSGGPNALDVLGLVDDGLEFPDCVAGIVGGVVLLKVGILAKAMAQLLEAGLGVVLADLGAAVDRHEILKGGPPVRVGTVVDSVLAVGLPEFVIPGVGRVSCGRFPSTPQRKGGNRH